MLTKPKIINIGDSSYRSMSYEGKYGMERAIEVLGITCNIEKLGVITELNIVENMCKRRS